MNENLIKTWNIQPDQFPGGKLYMSALDLASGFSYIHGLYFITSELDPIKFKDSVQWIVNQFPAIAGTMKLNDGRPIIDLSTGKVVLEYQELDTPRPKYGPGMDYPDIKHLFAPQVNWHPLPDEGGPVWLMRLTKHGDGTYTLGDSITHMFTDFYGRSLIDRAMFMYYAEAEITLTDLGVDRNILLDKCPLVDYPGTTPITNPELEPLLNEPTYYDSFKIMPGELAKMSASKNHLIRAATIKAFAEVQPKERTRIIMTLPYDLRFVKGFHLPRKYAGNAIIWGNLIAYDKELLVNSSIHDLLPLVQTSITAEVAKKDVGYLQNEYIKRKADVEGRIDGWPKIARREANINVNIKPAAHGKHTLVEWVATVNFTGNSVLTSLHAAFYPDGHARISFLLKKDMLTPFKTRMLELLGLNS